MVDGLQVGKTEHDTEENGNKLGVREAWDSNKRCSRGRKKIFPRNCSPVI
jgi:hypothetical protein